MAENSFGPQVEQAKAHIRSIVQEFKLLDAKIIESSKLVRENLSGAFNIKTPDGLNEFTKNLDTRMTRLNET